MKSKKNATYVKKSFVIIKMKKWNLNYTKSRWAEEFNGEFECLGENTEKYISFPVPIKKEHDNNKTITYKIKFVDTCRFMPSKLSDLVDNLSEINNKDCKTCIERKNISWKVSKHISILQWWS